MSNSIAFVFPGQASQVVGMGQQAVQQSAVAREIFEQADDLLGFALSDLCFNGPEAELNQTENTQIAVFVTSIAVLRATQANGCETQPAYLAGHSLGEYTAYVASGALSFAEGVHLVRARGNLMKQAGQKNPGGMAAILKLSDDLVNEICAQVAAQGNGFVQVGNYNSPGQVVISGHHQAIEAVGERVKQAKGRMRPIPVSVAPHSQLMSVVEPPFQALIDQLDLKPPQIPIIANVTAQPLRTVAEIRDEMAQQLTASVRWTASVQYMIEQGVTEFIEIGPKNVLTGLIRRIDKTVNTRNIDG